MCYSTLAVFGSLLPPINLLRGTTSGQGRALRPASAARATGGRRTAATGGQDVRDALGGLRRLRLPEVLQQRGRRRRRPGGGGGGGGGADGGGTRADRGHDGGAADGGAADGGGQGGGGGRGGGGCSATTGAGGGGGGGGGRRSATTGAGGGGGGGGARLRKRGSNVQSATSASSFAARCSATFARARAEPGLVPVREGHALC